MRKTAGSAIQAGRMMGALLPRERPMSTDTNPPGEADAKILLYAIAVAVALISAVLLLMYL
ncbi:hypothetical protein D3C83_19380 [compost metagenome]